MAPRKGTTSKSPANKSRATRGKAAADKKEAEDKNEVTATPTKKRKTGIATWLGKSDDSSESDEETSTAKVRDGSKQPAKSTTKSQRRLSGYLRTSKSTTNPKTGEKEEVEEERVTTAVSETTATPGQTITRTLQKEVVDTVTVSTKAANSGKKRKLEEDGDFEYTPAASTAKAIALAGAEEEGEEPWFLQRPRRKARDSAQSYAELIKDVLTSDIEEEEPNLDIGEDAIVEPNPVNLDHADDPTRRVLILKVPRLGELLGRVAPAEKVASWLSASDEADSIADAGSSAVVKTEEHEVTTTTVTTKKTPIRRPVGGWDNSKYRFKFGWSPYPDHAAPTHEEAAEVFELLRADLAARGVIVGPGERGEADQGPAHGRAQDVSVDAVVRTMMSQATNNENALLVQDIMKRDFTYLVDGKEVQGQIPNYHNVRLCSQADLAEIIKPAGIHNKRALFIKTYLDLVYKANTTDNPDWDGVHTGNEPNALDFVPGLLSLRFLDNMSKVDLFNWLLSNLGVGVKTAHCVMEFNYRMPVCAVDTHVLFMSAALGWLPGDCKDADTAAMHLDALLPDGLKHDLHQAFWNHRQHCAPCKRAAGEKVKGADAGSCVLEGRMLRRQTRKKEIYRKLVKVEGAARKPSTRAYEVFTAEKAAEEGYEYREIEIDDDFAAGSVNRKVKKMWVLRSE